MDENMSEEKRAENPEDTERQDSAKRMRTDFDHEECSGSSNNSENNSNSNECNDQSASTSSDSGLPASSAETENNQNGVDLFGASAIFGLIHAVNNGNDTVMDEEFTDARLDAESVSQLNGNTSDSNDLSCDSDVYSSHNSSSDNTIVHTTDTDSDEDAQVIEVMSKAKPKHTWFVVPEVINRQYGYGSRKANPSLFQQRCYGSLMNVQKLELMYKLEEHEGCVNSLNFSPNGNFLASGSDDLKVVIWDWRIGKSLLKVDTRHKRNIFQTKFLDLKGPDFHLATCGRDGQVWYLQISSDGLRDGRKLGQHRGPCHKLTVLKDQPHVVLSAGEDGIVFSHDVRKSKPDRIVHVKDDEREVALYSIHSHPLNSHEFCVAGREGSVKVYDQRKSSRLVTKFCPYKSTDPKYSRGLHITCAVYNHDGTEILASYNDDDVYLFDTDKGPGVYAHRYSGHRNAATIKGVSFFGPRSEFIMSGSDCAHIFFWEKKTESITQFLLADDNGVVNCLEPHPELPFLATSGLDWDVKLWVPSCEEEPALNNLAATIKENKRPGWGYNETSSDSQVLWMLWRRLRASRAASDQNNDDAEEAGFSFLTLDSSEDSSSESWRSHSDEDDLNEEATGCTTS